MMDHNPIQMMNFKFEKYQNDDKYPCMEWFVNYSIEKFRILLLIMIVNLFNIVAQIIFAFISQYEKKNNIG